MIALINEKCAINIIQTWEKILDMNNSFERSINGTVKPILDACCGGKMFYFDKNDERVLFQDIRKVSTHLCDGILHDDFWEWCRGKSCNNDVIISEYNAPEDFKCIWNYNIRSTVRNKVFSATEKLFVHESLYEKYI